MKLADLSSQFACMTFVAKHRVGDICGSNGLPLTPNSIKILGRSQYLKKLHHPNICSYIDILRGKHERTVVVSSYCGSPLSSFKSLTFREILLLGRHVLEALSYLHQNGVVHRSLNRDNILQYEGTWMLFNFGLYYMTGNGADVQFPIGQPQYSPPDVLLKGIHHQSSSKADVWSLGMILAELFLGCEFWSGLTLRSVLQKVMNLLSPEDVFLKLAKEANKLDKYMTLPSEVIDLLGKMLVLNPTQRPSADDLLKEEIFNLKNIYDHCPPTPNNRLNVNYDGLRQLYYYWQLAGGDVYSELKKEGLIRTKPPILSIPNLVMLEGTCFGQVTDQASALDQHFIRLNFDGLIERITRLKAELKFPVIELRMESSPSGSHESSLLPLVIRERDTEYQFKRLQVLNRVIMGCPYKKELLLKEARQDVPPFVRAKVWSIILGVESDYETKYKLIDKESPMSTDKQIEVDIPRCHQYNELLSSNTGHLKFKRVLKAWIKSHPQYVYWQGLDSLCAPFLFLNFDNEAMAYSCLSKFIPKYLYNFFLKDNSAIISEYLAKFKHLIAFQDPELANHLQVIAFAPEFFAIPWFLTMFSHVFPLHKILHLWDSLLLGDASYPLYIGLAILQQLRPNLLNAGFNECILLFSDLPEIDIERCVKESIAFYRGTPSSVTYRQHEMQSSRVPKTPEWEIQGLSARELEKETSPRMSGREFIDIMNNSTVRSKVLIIDVREPNQFEEQNVNGSINIPLSIADIKISSARGPSLLSKPELAPILANKGKIIIVIGEDSLSVVSFCQYLVHAGVPKVCSLHGGFPVLLSCKSILTN